MGKPTICVDIDNVLAATDEVMRRVAWQVTSGRVLLEYEDVKRYDYCECEDSNGQGLSREEWREVHRVFSLPRNLAEILPMPGAQEVWPTLRELCEVHIATSRLPAARIPTVAWLDAHGFETDFLHFTGHGTKAEALGAMVYAVEDCPDQAAAFAAEARLVFLIAHPWNEVGGRVAGVHRVRDWHQVVACIERLF